MPISIKAEHLHIPPIVVADLIDRMKEIYDCKTDRQLAEKIGVDSVIFYRWRDRETFHKEIVFAVAYHNNVSLNYLLFGQRDDMISANLSETETETFNAICKRQGLTKAGLVKFALGLYQEVCERLENGERIEFHGSPKVPVLVMPILQILRVRLAPRKQRKQSTATTTTR